MRDEGWRDGGNEGWSVLSPMPKVRYMEIVRRRACMHTRQRRQVAVRKGRPVPLKQTNVCNCVAGVKAQKVCANAQMQNAKAKVPNQNQTAKAQRHVDPSKLTKITNAK